MGTVNDALQGYGSIPPSNTNRFATQNNIVIAASVATKTADYTATISDGVILVDAVGGAVTITLPTAASMANRGLIVKKIDATGYAVTIDANGAETIDGNLSVATTTPWISLSVVSNGTAWFLI